ncbi:MAG: DNA gyrase inhibitor YacG [Hyphomicrobium sp.]|jgi:hypothetical protein
MSDRPVDEAAQDKMSKSGKCPICGKGTVHAVRPFCSARCAEIDLGRWVSGSYVIAGGLTDSDEDGDDAAARQGRDDDA